MILTEGDMNLVVKNPHLVQFIPDEKDAIIKWLVPR